MPDSDPSKETTANGPGESKEPTEAGGDPADSPCGGDEAANPDGADNSPDAGANAPEPDATAGNVATDREAGDGTTIASNPDPDSDLDAALDPDPEVGDDPASPDSPGDGPLEDPPALQKLAARLTDRVADRQLAAWHREQQARENIREGIAFFNEDGYVPPPPKHAPSRLCGCPRQAYYDLENAPAEDPTPEGTFWMGTHVEDDLVVPYLEAITPDTVYVQREAYVDYEVVTENGPLLIKGATDPLLVDRTGTILVPTEVKTTTDLTDSQSPEDRHRAQLSAYLYGLSQDREHNLTTGLILYVDRQTFATQAFTVDFDPYWWRTTVIEWAADLTEDRYNDRLPPAAPPDPGMCAGCPYRRRCGQTDHDIADAGVRGLVPDHVYPRERLEEYLASHDDATLTPACAAAYPELAAIYPVEEP